MLHSFFCCSFIISPFPGKIIKPRISIRGLLSHPADVCLLSLFLLPSRLYCRFRNLTGSAAARFTDFLPSGRITVGREFMLLHITLPRRIFYFTALSITLSANLCKYLFVKIPFSDAASAHKYGPAFCLVRNALYDQHSRDQRMDPFRTCF